MTDKQPEALRLADSLDEGKYEPADSEFKAANLLRSQHKQIAAYELLTKSQEAQLSQHRVQADKCREAIATLQSERDANALLTAAIERKDALLRQALDALENHNGNYKLTAAEADVVIAVEDAIKQELSQ